MLYTTELVYSLPRDSFNSLLEEVNNLHSRIWIHTSRDGKLFHYDCARAIRCFLLYHENPSSLKQSYDLMVLRNYVHIPLGIYAYLATITKQPGLKSDEVAGRLEQYFYNHFTVSSNFQKKHSAHMFSHLYCFLEREDKPVLDALMQRLLRFSPCSESRDSIKKEKLLWQRNLGLFCPSYDHEEMADSGVFPGITKLLGGDDALIAWVKQSLPGRLRMDFMKASGREDLLMQTLSAGAKRNKLNDELGL